MNFKKSFIAGFILLSICVVFVECCVVVIDPHEQGNYKPAIFLLESDKHEIPENREGRPL